MFLDQVLFNFNLFSLCCEFLSTEELLTTISSCTKRWNTWIKTSKLLWKNKKIEINSFLHLNKYHELYSSVLNNLSSYYFDDIDMDDHEELEKNWPTQNLETRFFSSFLFPEVTFYKIYFTEEGFTEYANLFLQLKLPKLKELELFYCGGDSLILIEGQETKQQEDFKINLPFEWNQLISLKLNCTPKYLKTTDLWKYLTSLKSTLKELTLEKIKLEKDIITITELSNLEKLTLTSFEMNTYFFSFYAKEEIGERHRYYSYDRKEDYPIHLFPGYKLKQLTHLSLTGFATCLLKSFSFREEEKEEMKYSESTINSCTNYLLSLDLDYDTHKKKVRADFSCLKDIYFMHLKDLCISRGSGYDMGFKYSSSNFINLKFLERLEISDLKFKESKSSFPSLLETNCKTLMKLIIYNTNLDLKDLHLCSNLRRIDLLQIEITEHLFNSINTNLIHLKRLDFYMPFNGAGKFHLLSCLKERNIQCFFQLEKAHINEEEISYLKNQNCKIEVYDHGKRIDPI